MTTLGKYELMEVIGKGGFGTVYRATDASLGRVVAIKVLNPAWMAEGSEAVERFRREARIMAQLDHPNVATIHEVGEERGLLYIVMRYLPGKSLAERLKAGPLSIELVLRILRDVCAGLQSAHAQGWVHRDLKPANILFDAEGRAVVTDFGLARAVQVSSSAASSSGTVGTPFYRAPELWRGRPPASPATDVYALGCILGEMLVGKPLFGGDTPDEIITKHLIDGPDFGSTWPPAGVPAGVTGVVGKALQRDPAQRYPCALDFYMALSQAQQNPVTGVTKPVTSTVLPTNSRPAGQGERLTLKLAEGVEMEFVRVPAGEFIMGGTDKENPGGNDIPQQKLFLPEYWMARTPVTVAQFAAFVKATGNKNTPKAIAELGSKPNHPVVNVNLQDTEEFCLWLSKVTGQLIRLPTEAEWEKAARGADGRTYPWGNQSPNGRCNFNSKSTSQVGIYSPQGDSPYGCVDMSGNVCEWCQGGWLRGGCWYFDESYLRSSNRYLDSPASMYYFYGFRCSSSLP